MSMAKQRNQDDGDEVTVGKLLRDAIQRHRRNGLDENDSVEDQIPKRERAAEPRNGRRRTRKCFPWVRLLDYGGGKIVNIKTFL